MLLARLTTLIFSKMTRRCARCSAHRSCARASGPRPAGFLCAAGPHQRRAASQTAARLAAAFGTEAASAGAIREYGDIGSRGSPASKGKPPPVPLASKPATPAERAAANKALFEAVKTQRNALRVELARTREELDATRAELARHCGDALLQSQHQASLHAELADRQSQIEGLRTRLASAEARAELAAAASSPHHHRYSAAAAMEAGAQAAEALRSQVEALQSDLILERARANAAAAAATAALAEAEAARLAEKAMRLSAPPPKVDTPEPQEAGGIVYPTDIMAMEVAAVSARCAALEARNAELEAAAAASAATAHQMTAELAMAAAMLDAQRGQIVALMDNNSRAGSAVSLGPVEKNLQAMDALTYIATAPAPTLAPSTPPPTAPAPAPVALPPDASAQPRRATNAPHNSLAEPALGEEPPLPKPSGAAALLGCTNTRATTTTPAPAPANGTGEGIVASAQKLFGLFG